MKKIEHIVEYIIDGDDLMYNDNHGRLIRCKDCRYNCGGSIEGQIMCQYWNVERSVEDFCSSAIFHDYSKCDDCKILCNMDVCNPIPIK